MHSFLKDIKEFCLVCVRKRLHLHCFKTYIAMSGKNLQQYPVFPSILSYRNFKGHGSILYSNTFIIIITLCWSVIQQLMQCFEQAVHLPTSCWAFGSSSALFSKSSFRFAVVACSRNWESKYLDITESPSHRQTRKSHSFVCVLTFKLLSKRIVVVWSVLLSQWCWLKHSLFYHIWSSQRYCSQENALKIVVFKFAFPRHDRWSNQETKEKNHQEPKDMLQNTCSKLSVEVTLKLNSDLFIQWYIALEDLFGEKMARFLF